MTKEQREKVSNRLVLNFGVLLVGCLALLYLNTALRNGPTSMDIAYLITLILMIVGLVSAVAMFLVGHIKKNALKNYSAIGLGVFIACLIIYLSRVILTFSNITAVILVYILMAVYFVVLSIYTAIQLKKPLIKSDGEKIVHKKKKR